MLLMSSTSPRPPSGQAQPGEDERYEREDLFATLFSPPTPPASPFPSQTPGTSSAASNTKPQSSAHSRKFSTSSNEFGSFVSVPAIDDPLYAEHQPVFSPISPATGLEFFDQFTDHAAKSNAQKRRVLDELLLHEDDPLYWVNDTNESTHQGPDAPEIDVNQLSSFPPVPPIPEEPSSSDLQGRGRELDRWVNEFSKPITT